MPDGDVVDVLVSGSDRVDESLEPTREGSGIGFEVLPTVFPLSAPTAVDVLPVVVDDQA